MLVLICLSLVLIRAESISQWYCGPPPPQNPNRKATYMILAPRTIRASLPYAISVNILQDQEEPVDVELNIVDVAGNAKLPGAKLAGIVSGNPTTVSFGAMSPELATSSTKLMIRAVSTETGETVFEKEQSLQMSTDSLAIFIQTDKALYKPGDLVQFRVVVTKPNLVPFKGFTNVLIMNAESTVIKQFKGLPLTKGVAQGELQLSDDPPLGDWSIVVGVEDRNNNVLPEKKKKMFEVGKFVLPKFDAKLTIPSFAIHGEDIPVTVTSKYTFGQGVRGDATVTIQEANGKAAIQETVALSNMGTATIVFKYVDMLEQGLVKTGSKASLTILASVEESLTGIMRNTTAAIMVHVNREKIIFLKQAEYFRPGLSYTIMISVVQMDNTPLPPDADRTVAYTATFFTGGLFSSKKEVFSETIQLETDGTKEVVLKVPKQAGNLEFKADHKNGKVSKTLHIRSFRSSTNSFIQLTSDTNGKTKVGDDASFTVAKSDDFDVNSITLQLISKGSVVFTTKANPSENKYSFSVPITHSMAPKSDVVVYAIRSDNDELLADSLTLQVDGLFRNDVTVEINPKEAKPFNDDGLKNEVTVTVNADPESFVGLLGVDQSVILSKSGNDITQSDIEKEMEKYDNVAQGTTNRFRFDFHGGFQGTAAKQLIEKTGVAVLTDAFVDQCVGPFGCSRSCFECGSNGIQCPIDRVTFRDERECNFVCTPVNIVALAAVNGGPIAAPPPAPPGAPPPRGAPPSQPKAETESSVKIRTEFPETWVWSEHMTNADGKVVHKVAVPETITSFVLSAFATNDDTGLGIAPVPAKLTVFRPFFVSLNLPFSVKQGEHVAIQALVFNFGEMGQMVIVTLDRGEDPGFDFLQKSTDKETNGKSNERKILVNGGGGSASVRFGIIPTVIGHIKLLVTAVGETAADGVERQLQVEPEGIRVFFNRPMVLEFTGDEVSFEATIDMTPPAEIENDFVDGSERAEFSVLGDLMGPLLSGLESLVRMPFGCGEQNMITVVPNIIVMKYLDATGETENFPKLSTQARKFMEIGYQRELKFKRKDGSFSAFGNSDKEGSTWLTAYVLRSFHDAKDFISVDSGVLKESVTFLNKRQGEDGEFKEQGRVIHKEMQGGGGNAGVPITAFVLISLIRSGYKNPKAVEYLEGNLDEYRSRPYAVAITGYALGLAGSAKLDRALDILTDTAINEDGQRHWAVGEGNATEWWQDGPKPAEVETTSYALLAYMLADRFSDALLCIRWLSAKRNSLGGFSSTQDTVVGIGAIAEYAKRISKEMDITIDITQEGRTTSLTLNDENKVVLQKIALGSLNEPVTINARGKGVALAQVSWYFNVRKLSDSRPFECNTIAFEGSSGKDVTVALCCKYNLKGKSNMAVLTVEAPTGFKVDNEKLSKLPGQVRKLKSVETSKEDTLASIYFDDLDNDFSCFEITSLQLFDVAEQKPSQITCRDYYATEKMIQLNYSRPNAMSLEEQCDDC